MFIELLGVTDCGCFVDDPREEYLVGPGGARGRAAAAAPGGRSRVDVVLETYSAERSCPPMIPEAENL